MHIWCLRSPNLYRALSDYQSDSDLVILKANKGDIVIVKEEPMYEVLENLRATRSIDFNFETHVAEEKKAINDSRFFLSLKSLSEELY